jgi:hypothetical protein
MSADLIGRLPPRALVAETHFGKDKGRIAGPRSSTRQKRRPSNIQFSSFSP